MIRELFLEDLSLWGCIWQSTLFALIGLAGSFLLKRRPARASQVLFLAIIAAVLLPAMSVLVRHYGLGLLLEKPIALPSFQTEITAETPEILIPHVIQPAAIELPTGTALVDSSSETIRIPWRLILLYVWMIASLILLGRLIIAFIGGIRLLRRAQSDHCEHIRSAADSARARLGITKVLNIRSSMDVRSPMIWCWNRPPVLLMPDDLDGRFDWVDVICHELAHWKRWDHVSGLIAELAVCVLPWNPLLWWSKKRMLRLSEQACDDWVLAGGCAGTDYAQSLLNLSPELQMAFMPAVIGKEKPMKERIYRIVKEKCGIPQIGARWAFAVTMIAASVTVGVALAQRRPARFESPERDERIAAERREREMPPRPDRAPRREILRRLEELGNETEMVLQRLAEQNFGRNDETNMLYDRMRELNEQMRQVRRRLGRQLEEPDRQRQEFRREGRSEEKLLQINELRERARQIELELKELGGENPERAENLHAQLREIHEAIAQRERELASLRERDVPRMLLRKFREHARELEFRLQEIGDRNPEEAQEIRMQLDQIHRQIQEIEREPGIPERPWPRDEEPMQPGNELLRAKLMIQQTQIQAQMRELEHVLQELNEQEKADSEEARLRQRELFELRKLLQETENELRGGEPDRTREPGRDDLEREVQNLRKQMDGMNEQMGEMRELMKRLLEKN